MCVSALAIGISTQWPLVIAGNRDEFLDRPTLALHEWQTPSGRRVWGGRDEQDGGGWMLMAPDGSAAALVTNVRDAQLKRGERSRGQITLNWIDAVAQGEHEAFWHQHDWHHYGGFNLICGVPRTGQWWYFSNRTERPAREMQPGLYGLSNAELDSPWPKSRNLKSMLGTALSQATPEELAMVCWPALSNTEHAQDEHLPDTGVGFEIERQLSSVFIDWPSRRYGTRSSHIICLDAQGRTSFQERTYTADSAQARQAHFTLRSLSAY
jgi:uncharacterized protein with NRDE domain